MAPALIPGLPNELAMECLLRLPHDHVPSAMRVNSLWKIALAGDRLYVQRRLSRPYTSLFLICGFRNGQGPLEYDFLDFDLTNLSAQPRRLFSFRACQGPAFFVSPVACPCPDNNSVFVLDEKQYHGTMQFNIIYRRWTCFKPFDFEARRVNLLGCLGDSIFLNVHEEEEVGSSPKCLRFDCSSRRWLFHHGLPDLWATACNFFTCQGKMFVRESAPYVVKVFDPSTNMWKAHADMTDRLANVQPYTQVAGMQNGTLISCKPTTAGSLYVKMQEAGAMAWFNTVEIRLSSSKIPRPVQFRLLNKDKEVLLLIRSNGRKSRCEEHLFGNCRLNCLYVPCHFVMSAVIIHG